MYDAPRIAAQTRKEDPPAVEDTVGIYDICLSPFRDAESIQHADPTRFCHRNRPDWWTRKGPLEVYNDFRHSQAEALEKTKLFLSSALKEKYPSHELKLQHYSNCREVAGWHQAIELFEQGMAAFWAARDDEILIFQRNRYVLRL